jgi:hypothetical protein
VALARRRSSLRPSAMASTSRSSRSDPCHNCLLCLRI